MKRTRYSGHPYTPAKTELLSSVTIHGHVRTLRAFFNWLVVEGLAQNSPAKDLKPPKVSRKVVSTLSDEEIGAILNTFSISPSDARNRTLFMFLIDTGLRISELVNLKMADVHMDEGYLKEMGVQRLDVSHCTGFHASTRLAQEFEEMFFMNNAGTCITLP
jgi:site-specific recombinase XerD